MKKIILITLPLIALAIFAAAYSQQKNADENKTTALRKVKTQTAKAITYQEIIFASGQLASKEEVKLSFKTGGIIERLYVKEGQTVKKGQILAILNLAEIEAQAQQAELGKYQAAISIDNAKLALKIAERDYRNALGLYQDSVATLEQLENAELQRDNARNQLEAATTNLEFNQKNITIANFNVDHSRILAPANGVILKKVAEANELVGSGFPVFIFGTKDKAQVIRVSLTDKDIIHVNFQDSASISFDAYPDIIFQGRVQEVASMADPYTGTYEVEISVQHQGKKLLSGLVGQVHIHTQARQDLLSIPVDALVSADQRKGFVFTINDEKAIKSPIDIYTLQDDQILIRRGIEADQEVVVQGAGYLHHNEKVEIIK